MERLSICRWNLGRINKIKAYADEWPFYPQEFLPHMGRTPLLAGEYCLELYGLAMQFVIVHYDGERYRHLTVSKTNYEIPKTGQIGFPSIAVVCQLAHLFGFTGKTPGLPPVPQDDWEVSINRRVLNVTVAQRIKKNSGGQTT